MPNIFYLLGLFFTIIIGFYFLKDFRKNYNINKFKEINRLKELREGVLSLSLSEEIRPKTFEDIVGQEDGLKALKGALWGSNPQHIIIYGPPGVGKTAAAKVVLEEAKKNDISPFNEKSKFIEIDATTLRFDDKAIEDPLMGSVYYPIYQGVSLLEEDKILQPKLGAVTKANGGILFIDEIAELHPLHMNKLLKVLEDKRVFLESPYYNPENVNIPTHIHEIFKNGLPADFILVGATTKAPGDLPIDLRSRCIEIYFPPLTKEEIVSIIKKSCHKSNFQIEERAVEEIKKYAKNGRQAINIIEIAQSLALTHGRKKIILQDVQWVIQKGYYNSKSIEKVGKIPVVGFVKILAVGEDDIVRIVEIEASAIKLPIKGRGRIIVTGIDDKVERKAGAKSYQRKAPDFYPIDNILTVIKNFFKIDIRDYDIHVNIHGGVVIDDPSYGIGIVVAIYSAITNKHIDPYLAITGEITIKGNIKAVGEIMARIKAAKEADFLRILIPQDNYQEGFEEVGIEVIPVEDIQRSIPLIFLKD